MAVGWGDEGLEDDTKKSKAEDDWHQLRALVWATGRMGLLLDDTEIKGGVWNFTLDKSFWEDNMEWEDV